MNNAAPEPSLPALRRLLRFTAIAAIVLILAGSFMLLTNLGLIDISLRELLRTWWPIILIAVGIGLFLTPERHKK